MRVLIAPGDDIETSEFLMQMVASVVMFEEGRVIIVGVIAVREPRPREELVRFGDFFEGFQIAAPVGKYKPLQASVRAFRFDGLCGPSMTALCMNTPVRRNSLLEHL